MVELDRVFDILFRFSSWPV